MSLSQVGNRFIDLETRLASELSLLQYPDNVEYVYNPLSYAISTHKQYVIKYANESPKQIMFLGMNPGPWGMAQTGVPFGEVNVTREWLKIDGAVGKPEFEHPKKLIKGFDCTRREVSGERFWTFMSSLCETPESFFKNCIVYNHCPLVYMSKTGKNLTPPDLEITIRQQILKLCDESLKAVIDIFQVQHIVGIGRFAEKRAKKILEQSSHNYKGDNVNVHFLLHPSPASAIANKNWSSLAHESLLRAGLIEIVQGK